MLQQYHRYRIFLMTLDVVVSVLVLMSVVALRPYLPGETVDPTSVMPNEVIYLMQALLWHMVFALTGVYSSERVIRFSSQLSRFSWAYILAVIVFAGLLFFSFREISRLLVIYFAASNYVVLVAIRFFLNEYLEWKRKGGGAVPTVILGSYDNAIRVARRILADHSTVLRLVGFCDTEEPQGVALPGPFLGIIKNLGEIVRDHKVEMVIIARTDVLSTAVSPLPLQSIMFQLERLPVNVYLAPDVFSLALVESDVQRFGDLVLIGLREPVIRTHRRVLKRILDLVLCTLTLVFTWPVFIILWIMIKRDSPGPGIISVPRVGQNGKIFRMYKFRSMVMGAEHLQDKVITTDEYGEKIYKAKYDPRVTKVGKWLRSTSLDELPQLYNVFRGEMSCVGPRPEQPFITDHYDHWQWQRVAVPPGVTGWWQVSGRADLPMHLNTEYDVYYVKNYSVFLDLKILFKTIIAIVKAKGAY